jgi:hypothetical protein
MENQIDIDIDELDKDFEKAELNKKKEIRKQFDFIRMGIITFCLVVISIIVYINGRNSILNDIQNANNAFVSNELSNCDTATQKKAKELTPGSSVELDAKTQQLNSLGKELLAEKIALGKEFTDSADMEVYKRDVELFNSKLENYQNESALHQKEINEYDSKVKLYYDFLKVNCVENK